MSIIYVKFIVLVFYVGVHDHIVGPRFVVGLLPACGAFLALLTALSLPQLDGKVGVDHFTLSQYSNTTLDMKQALL